MFQPLSIASNLRSEATAASGNRNVPPANSHSPESMVHKNPLMDTLPPRSIPRLRYYPLARYPIGCHTMALIEIQGCISHQSVDGNCQHRPQFELRREKCRLQVPC